MRRRAHSSHGYLAPLARILHATGHSPRTLLREFSEICRELPRLPTPARARATPHLRDLPHVLAHWHTEPEFLDAEGNARPLPLRGRTSVASVIRRVYPRANLRAVMEALERNRAIRRQGRLFVPKGRSIRYATAEIPAHGLEALRGLLRTLEHNVSYADRTKRLFERFALNPRVPLRAIGRFDRHMRQQALEFLFGLDAELGRLEKTRRRGERTARVGVGVYFFEEPTESPRARGRSRRSARGARNEAQ